MDSRELVRLTSYAACALAAGGRRRAEAGTAGGQREPNRGHVDQVFGARLQIDSAIPPALVSLLAEAETSGGLLFSVPRDRGDGVTAAFRAAGEECWEIGEVVADPVIRIRA